MRFLKAHISPGRAILPVCICLFTGIHHLSAQVKSSNNYLDAGIYKELDYRKSYLMTVTAGREYEVRWHFRLGGEFNVYRFLNADYSAIGLGIRPVVRQSFFQREGFALFAEVKGGIIYMLPDRANTALNYTFVGGIGSDISIAGKRRLRIGAGYSHFSNGRYRSKIENPSWDGIGGYAGWLF